MRANFAFAMGDASLENQCLVFWDRKQPIIYQNVRDRLALIEATFPSNKRVAGQIIAVLDCERVQYIEEMGVRAFNAMVATARFLEMFCEYGCNKVRETREDIDQWLAEASSVEH